MQRYETGPWVVYQTTVPGRPGAVTVVCSQREWDALERARPGHHTLVREGIASEAEAERVARDRQAQHR
jgi:hypothetical protein